MDGMNSFLFPRQFLLTQCHYGWSRSSELDRYHAEYNNLIFYECFSPGKARPVGVVVHKEGSKGKRKCDQYNLHTYYL